MYSPSLSLSFFFSTDYCQSSHAVHLLRLWRRPSESPSPLSLSQLKSHAGHFPSFFSLHILPSCPLSLSISMNTTHYIAASLVCSPAPPSLISLLPVISFSSVCVFNLYYDLKRAALLYLLLLGRRLLLLNLSILTMSFTFSFYRFFFFFFFIPLPLTVFNHLPQDTAEYVAYVAKDPVNQRGEQKQQKGTLTQVASANL